MTFRPVALVPAAIDLYRRICEAHGLPIESFNQVEFHGADGDSDLIFFRGHLGCDQDRIHIHPGIGCVVIRRVAYWLPAKLEVVK